MAAHAPILIIGAGAGGLAAAIALAASGHPVEVLERGPAPGGKMRRVKAGEFDLDAGPTVFTMRWVFEDLLREAGTSLADRLTLEPAEILARHAWTDGSQLDLYASLARSAEAIGDFAGAREAQGFSRMMTRARDIHATLAEAFMASEQPGGSLTLMRRLGPRGLPGLVRTAPMRTLWGALGNYFRDPRLRQLFARYATYVGASPLHAPATLMLIAWVEQTGVWRVIGGMRALAAMLAEVAVALGVKFHFDTHVAAIHAPHGAVAGVTLASGDRMACQSLIYNGDTAALGSGLLGSDVQPMFRSECNRQRSLSALTFCVAARTSGFPLSHHNVFFPPEYPPEFRTIFGSGEIIERPTVYVCAQARSAADTPPPAQRRQAEPLLLLINAPADGDRRSRSPEEIDVLRTKTLQMMADCGAIVHPESEVVTGPAGFEALFPGRGGALYGAANHGPFASFARPGPATPVRGLYLAGGSAHPGAGVPMATLSGRLAAARLLADRAGNRGSAVAISVPRAATRRDLRGR